MRLFYIVAAVVAIGLGLAPFYLIPPVDLSALQGRVADPLPPDAPPGVKPTYHNVSVLYDSYGAKIKSLDPATAGDTSSAALQGNFYESLYAYSYLKRPPQDNVVPQLAQALPEISPDGLTYTIRLKKGVLYHANPCFGVQTGPDGKVLMEDDGKTPRYKTRELVADDFILAFKRIADYHVSTELSLAFIEDKIQGISEYRAKTQLYERGDFSRYTRETITGIKAPDPYTLQIRLTVPFPQLLFVLAINNYAPIPHEVIDYYLSTHDVDGLRAPLPLAQRSPIIHDYQACVGTGPYYLDTFIDGGRIILRRNPQFRPEYYPSEGDKGDKEAGLLDDAGKRLPFIDVVYQDYVAEANSSWMQFMTRQTDVSAIPMEVYRQVITPTKELDAEFTRKGIRLIKYGSPAVYWLTLNMQDPVLGKSKSLRQALNLGFNVEDFIRVLHNDRGSRAVNIVPTGFEGHDEAGPSPYAHFNQAQAKAKLEDARKELVAAKVIKPGDPIPTLKLDLGGTDEETRRIAEFTQQQFKAIGVNLKIELQTWPTLLAKMANKQCQIYSSGWHADYPDPENFLQLFYTPNIERGTNNSNYSDPEFDKLYQQAVVMPPSPQRRELYIKMIRMLNEDCPFLLQSEPVSFILVQPWVHNVKPHPIGYGFLRYWRLDEAQRQKAGGR